MRPRLLQLRGGGPLLLSGGRYCSGNTTDIFVWAKQADSDAFERTSLSYEHNQQWAGDDSYVFDAKYVNGSDFSGKTMQTLACTQFSQPNPFLIVL